MINYNKKWYKKWWGILIITITTIILSIFFSFVFLILHAIKDYKNSQFNGQNYSRISVDPEILETIEGKNNYWLGSSRPKITIVEFGDFACPYCQKSFYKIREISRKYKDDVKFIYRDFPVITDYSQDLAMGARCAGEQGLFWLMYDKFFLNQYDITTIDKIKTVAKQIGVNEKKFNDCINKNKYLVDIQEDFRDGQKLGVEATPVWFINGHKIEGNIPYEYFIKLIEDLISN